MCGKRVVSRTLRMEISIPQKHPDWPSAICVGSGRRRSCVSYVQPVIAEAEAGSLISTSGLFVLIRRLFVAFLKLPPTTTSKSSIDIISGSLRSCLSVANCRLLRKALSVRRRV